MELGIAALLPLAVALSLGYAGLPCNIAHAEPPATHLALSLHGGFERGGRAEQAIMKTAPVFLDGAVRQRVDGEVPVWLGGSLRVELQGASHVGLVPRAEVPIALGSLELRPGIALPFYVAPYTLLGPEASLALRVPLGPPLALIGSAHAAAFIAGSDLPKRSSIVQLALGIGLEIAP